MPSFNWNPQAHSLYISLGANIRPETNLPRATARLNKFGQVIGTSRVWETAPVGAAGPSFLNAVVQFQASYPPTLLKSLVLRRIESEMGRIRTFHKYAPRPIDLDILIADGQIFDHALWSRAHLAVPLAELLPDLLHPVSGQSLNEIAEELCRPEFIRLRPDVNLL